MQSRSRWQEDAVESGGSAGDGALSASPAPRFCRLHSALPTGPPWVFNLTDATPRQLASPFSCRPRDLRLLTDRTPFLASLPARWPYRVEACRIATTHLTSSGPRLGPLGRHFLPAQRLPADSLVPTRRRRHSPTCVPGLQRDGRPTDATACQCASSLALLRVDVHCTTVSAGIEPYTNHCVHWYPTMRKCSCATDSLTRHGSLLLLCGVSSAACVALRLLLAGNAARSPSQCFGPEGPPGLSPTSSLLPCICLLYVVCTSPLRAPHEPPLRSNLCVSCYSEFAGGQG